MRCGLVSGQDWLHYIAFIWQSVIVADWSQARIGYTGCRYRRKSALVADWSQARIGYTIFIMHPSIVYVADWSQARIGYTFIVFATYWA